jgi:hypothetical protein
MKSPARSLSLKITVWSFWRLDAGDVIFFHIFLHGGGGRFDLGESVAELRQPTDQGGVIGERGGLHMRIAQPLDAALDIDRGDLARPDGAFHMAPWRSLNV